MNDEFADTPPHVLIADLKREVAPLYRPKFDALLWKLVQDQGDLERERDEARAEVERLREAAGKAMAWLAEDDPATAIRGAVQTLADALSRDGSS